MNVLDEHCARLGRDPATICRTRLGTAVVASSKEEAQERLARHLGVTVGELTPAQQQRIANTMFIGRPDTVREQVQELLAAGLDGLIFNLLIPGDADEVAHVGDALSGALA